MAPIADERLGQLAEVVSAEKITPAAARVRTSRAPARAAREPAPGRRTARGSRRLLCGRRSRRRSRALELELLVADRDHVERRLERVTKQAKSGDPELRAEVARAREDARARRRGRALAEWAGELPPELEPLTTKPIIAGRERAAGIDVKLEAELAEMPEEEAAAFREAPPRSSRWCAGCFEALGLITFFTAGEKETRGWTLRRGQTALEAAATIHTDIARGFIRCEVVRWDDLVEGGSYAEVARRGLQRLEGKTYVVQDGDVLTVRFNV